MEARLVWNRSGFYQWHIVIEDGEKPDAAPGEGVVAGDLGEVHPLAMTDGQEAVVFSARQLRSIVQGTNKKLAEIQHKQAAKGKGRRG